MMKCHVFLPVNAWQSNYAVSNYLATLEETYFCEQIQRFNRHNVNPRVNQNPSTTCTYYLHEHPSPRLTQLERWGVVRTSLEMLELWAKRSLKLATAPDVKPSSKFTDQPPQGLVLPHNLNFSAAPERLLQVAYDVLPVGGLLCLSAFNPQSFWRQPNDTTCMLNPRQMRQLIESQGFSLQAAAFLGYALYVGRGACVSKNWEYAGNRWWPHKAAVYAMAAGKV